MKFDQEWGEESEAEISIYEALVIEFREFLTTHNLMGIINEFHNLDFLSDRFLKLGRFFNLDTNLDDNCELKYLSSTTNELLSLIEKKITSPTDIEKLYPNDDVKIIIHRRTNTIHFIKAGMRHTYNPKKRIQFIMDAATKVLELCFDKHKRGLRIMFNRKTLCKQLKIDEDTKMAHIFRNTPFWPADPDKRLIVKAGSKYIYTLIADLDSSSIEYELK